MNSESSGEFPPFEPERRGITVTGFDESAQRVGELIAPAFTNKVWQAAEICRTAGLGHVEQYGRPRGQRRAPCRHQALIARATWSSALRARWGMIR
jgi:hypothetical protein